MMPGWTFGEFSAVVEYGGDGMRFLEDAARGRGSVDYLVSAKDCGGRTALHLAARKGEGALLRRLIRLGADPFARDDLQRTALHHLVLVERDMHLPAVEALLEEARGAAESPADFLSFVNAQDSRGWTALHLLLDQHPQETSWTTGYEILCKLLAAGADPARETEGGWTPLHLACIRPHSYQVLKLELLLHHGAPADQPTKDGWTPLHLALLHENCAHVLLRAGARQVPAPDGRSCRQLASAQDSKLLNLCE